MAFCSVCQRPATWIARIKAAELPEQVKALVEAVCHEDSCCHMFSEEAHFIHIRVESWTEIAALARAVKL